MDMNSTVTSHRELVLFHEKKAIFYAKLEWVIFYAEISMGYILYFT
jgi:hypothetical protein